MPPAKQMICLNSMLGQRADWAMLHPRTLRKGMMTMVTYSDLFTFVIMLCAVISLVITFIRKK